MRQTFSTDNTLPDVLELIAKIVAFLESEGLNARSLFIGELVLEEMLTNMVKYAYDDSLNHQIGVVAEVEAGQVCLELRDDGHCFDPLQAKAPDFGIAVTDQTPGGRGIYLVKKLTQEVCYRREGEWNVLTVRFPAAAPSPG